MKFSGDKISDQKRLARGEQLMAARYWLRLRDGVHHAKWRVMILAGGDPSGEVAAIREVMPKAHITAVDRDPACLEAAINAGVDEVVHVDLSDFEMAGNSSVRNPPQALQALPRFDLVSLDLCSGANEPTRQLIAVNRRLTAHRGVCVFTISYGRDVQEVFAFCLNSTRGWAYHAGDPDGTDHTSEKIRRNREWCERLKSAKVPDGLAGRLSYLIGSRRDVIKSVIAYRGNEMPMCSVLLCGSNGGRTRFTAGPDTLTPLSYVQLEPGDLELAACYPETANLYDCPADRIASFRRSFAAKLAVNSRRAKELATA